MTALLRLAGPFGPTTILAVFVIFCRIGACLMLMPGFSSPRVPVQARLFVAIAVTLALAPLLVAQVQPSVADDAPLTLARTILFETLTGGAIGMVGRLFLLALETMATVAATAVGLGNALGNAIDNDDLTPPLVSFVTFAATILIFATDQHWEVLRGLVQSYAVLPVRGGFDPQFGLVQVVDGAGRAFVLTLRISSPFIIFAVVVNLALGIANKLTPQIPVYFISVPFVIAAGMVLLYVVARPFFGLFIAGFSNWLTRG